MNFPPPTTTRIADLPDTNGQSQQQTSPTTYTPINIHPNPYGNNAVVMPPAPPIQSSQGRSIENNETFNYPPPPQSSLTHEQQMMLQSIPTQKLPSRDIRTEHNEYTQDEEIKPNFIPHSSSSSNKHTNYIEDDEIRNRKEEKQYTTTKYRQSIIDKLAEEFQTPFFMAVLFMVFQLNALNKWMHSNLQFLKLFGEDGNINVNGMFFKSLLFGIVYYVFIIIQNNL